jgi:UDP-N-acetylglucosamine 1-carboxyvinyltransferase
VRALDLRAGIALCLAGLMADGATTVRDAWQVERGYSNFASKLRALGGRIDVG